MKTVSLFIPCIVDLFLPDIGESTVKLLRRVGVEPIYHEAQTCCGQPAYNAGRNREAVKLAKYFIEIFSDETVIVSPSGSCVLMVKQHYPELLAQEPEWLNRAENIAGRIYELSQYIVDVLGITDVGAAFNGKVTYHESCQLTRGLGVSEQPKKLIHGVEGAEYVSLKDADICCGFGGHFSVNYPEISEALVSKKARRFIASKADVLIVSEPGCFLNINGYLSSHHPESKAMHIASFLAEAK